MWSIAGCLLAALFLLPFVAVNVMQAGLVHTWNVCMFPWTLVLLVRAIYAEWDRRHPVEDGDEVAR